MRANRAKRAWIVALVAAVVAAIVALAAAGDENRPGERLVSVQWRRDASRPSGPKTIPILYAYRGYVCQYRFHSVRVKGTDETVIVAVLLHWREMKSGEACTAQAGGGKATVHLEHKLGDRKLRHAPVNDPPPGY